MTAAGCAEPTDDASVTPGRFEAVTIDDDVAIGYGLAVGDVDGDGDPDILLADKKQFAWYRNPDWTRFVMADSLTEHDNVCIAARDIDGDGQVEVAVGAQWNPGETVDSTQSGSVHYLARPRDPTQPWTPVRLPHEPTVHRMRWVRVGPDAYHLVVLPLHGRGNRDGTGSGVRVLAYVPPSVPLDGDAWATVPLDDRMHRTHNFDVVETDAETRLYIAGLEGIAVATARDGAWTASTAEPLDLPGMREGAGEVRVGRLTATRPFVTAIEAMHGTDLTVYIGDAPARQVLDTTFAQGHGLVAADVLGLGFDQIVAGWRSPNAEDRVGVKLYVPQTPAGDAWTAHLLDADGMALEDVKAADFDGDGRLDLVAAGRSTHNLKIYWNRTAS